MIKLCPANEERIKELERLEERNTSKYRVIYQKVIEAIKEGAQNEIHNFHAKIKELLDKHPHLGEMKGFVRLDALLKFLNHSLRPTDNDNSKEKERVGDGGNRPHQSRDDSIRKDELELMKTAKHGQNAVSSAERIDDHVSSKDSIQHPDITADTSIEEMTRRCNELEDTLMRTIKILEAQREKLKERIYRCSKRWIENDTWVNEKQVMAEVDTNG